MGRSKYFFALSGVILLIGALAVGGKGLNLGIDFTSGTRVVAELNQKTDDQGVRDALDSDRPRQGEDPADLRQGVRQRAGLPDLDRHADAPSERTEVEQR